eukprot:TRINITY_DN1860_c0_g1_i3.p2 TRINITY_DN1860_c0_g1~~TRINITY_DN1860_c0_g1_i3.p2  ORF type:complete len:280 (-),score=-17.77 TRINITY_DN1860_c0_g1_i3:20-859(-)
MSIFSNKRIEGSLQKQLVNQTLVCGVLTYVSETKTKTFWNNLACFLTTFFMVFCRNSDMRIFKYCLCTSNFIQSSKYMINNIEGRHILCIQQINNCQLVYVLSKCIMDVGSKHNNKMMLQISTKLQLRFREFFNNFYIFFIYIGCNNNNIIHRLDMITFYRIFGRLIKSRRESEKKERVQLFVPTIQCGYLRFCQNFDFGKNYVQLVGSCFKLCWFFGIYRIIVLQIFDMSHIQYQTNQVCAKLLVQVTQLNTIKQIYSMFIFLLHIDFHVLGVLGFCQ